jgi:SHS2 domain-containing protein
MYEILEHTADIGFRARGATLEELFEAAAEALTGIVLDTGTVEARERYELSAEGEDRESLLVNWLSEVLYWLDGKRVAFRRFHVRELGPARVTAEAEGEPRNPARHGGKLDVKGVTYHQLRISRRNGEWAAEVFLDV